jgi:hypothetical protein
VADPIRGFPPGMVPETVPLPRQSMGQQTPIVYSPVFQRPLMAQYREFPYLINPDTNPLILPGITGAGGSVVSQFTIDGDNDYFLETLRCFDEVSAMGLTGSGVTGVFTLQITDTRSGAQLGSSPMHIRNVAGTGQLPGYWSQLDWLVSPAGSRATLRIDLVNLTTITNTVWLCISGRRQLVNPGMPRTQLTK